MYRPLARSNTQWARHGAAVDARHHVRDQVAAQELGDVRGARDLGRREGAVGGVQDDAPITKPRI
jgi:hypothetical protein